MKDIEKYFRVYAEVNLDAIIKKHRNDERKN